MNSNRDLTGQTARVDPREETALREEGWLIENIVLFVRPTPLRDATVLNEKRVKKMHFTLML